MKVLVIGDFIYDKYNYGETNGLSPESGLPIFEPSRTEYCFGGAANLALNCHHHADTTLYAALAPGPAPLPAPFKLVNLGGKTVTTTIERFVVDETHLFRSDEKKYEPINIDDVETDEYDIVLLSDYNKGCVHSPQKLIQKAKCPVIVDPYKCVDWSKYAGAFCLKPNQTEFEQVCGEVTIDNIREAIEKYTLHAMLVTLGSDGALWVTKTEVVHVEAPRVNVVDVNGAGDTFAAIFSCYFDANDIKKSLDLATKAAGFSITIFGTHAVTKHELFDETSLESIDTTNQSDSGTVKMDKWLNKRNSVPDTETGLTEVFNDEGMKENIPKNGIFDWVDRTIVRNSSTATCVTRATNGTVFTVTTARNGNMTKEGSMEMIGTKKKKVVFTNGCFDILHVNHLRFLKEARSLGDKLIVGLNSDTSVSRIKRIPINNQAMRKELLEGISGVDEVIIFNEDTPWELINKLRPQIIVKGGENPGPGGCLTGEELVERAVIISTEREAVSTTSIITECHRREVEKGLK